MDTINDKRTAIYSLLQEFFDEYNRIDSTRIQSRCENDLELKRLSNIILFGPSKTSAKVSSKILLLVTSGAFK